MREKDIEEASLEHGSGYTAALVMLPNITTCFMIELQYKAVQQNTVL
jgi:hypothetical protein